MITTQNGTLVVITDNKQTIPIVEILETIDGLVDYADIKAAYPELSFANIYKVIEQIRKLITNANLTVNH